MDYFFSQKIRKTEKFLRLEGGRWRRGIGTRTTKIGDKVEPSVISKPASAHNRCAYEQRHCLSPPHLYVCAPCGDLNRSLNSPYYTANAWRIIHVRVAYYTSHVRRILPWAWRQSPRQLTSRVSCCHTVRWDFLQYRLNSCSLDYLSSLY